MPARKADGFFRLAVDRVFTLPGHGTIVAGTVFSGRVQVGETVLIMPGNFSARVRSIHAQNHSSEAGVAGQRCALNLAGVEKSAISRGDWIGDPRVLVSSKRIDARVRLLSDAKVKLTTGSTIHVHLGAAHTTAHLLLLESEHLHAGASALGQLVFETPVCALPGDRFIIRDAQAAHTIGGGTVLDSSAPSRKRRSEQRLRYLGSVEKLLAREGLSQLLANSPMGVSVADLQRLMGTPEVVIPTDAVVRDSFVLLVSVWESLREDALIALREFHVEFPEDPGPDSGRLRRIARPDMPTLLWATLVDELARDGSIIRHGPWLQLPHHAATLSESDQELAQQLQSLISQARPEPPWVRDLAVAVRQPEDRVRQVLRRQVACGAVCQIVHDLFYDSDRVDTLAGVIASLAHEQGSVNAARYRDAIGLGRKRTIQILEFFDRVGYTRRVQDVHVLRKDSGWIAGRPH